MAYETTEVAVEKSQGEIRKLLTSHQATSFSFGEALHQGVPWALVEFTRGQLRVRIAVPHKPPTEAQIREKVRRALTRSEAQIRADVGEQEARRIWRVLYHGLKARMISVEEAVETFEQAFLPYLVDPVSGKTLWEATKPLVQSGALDAGGQGIEIGPPALPAPPRAVTDDDIVDAEVVG